VETLQMDVNTSFRLRDILERFEHKRELIIGVIFKRESGAVMKHLDPEFDSISYEGFEEKRERSYILRLLFQGIQQG